jgi:hypothetical protein
MTRPLVILNTKANRQTAACALLQTHRAKIQNYGSDGCWIWAAGKNSKGYGVVWAREKMRYVHREVYEEAHGYGSAEGLVVRHKCDTRACCNPAHLEIGTHADNMRDKFERGRSAYATGQANGSAKLSASDVLAIRAAYSDGEHGQKANLARLFGVRDTLIGKIIRREIWKHLP